MTMELDETLKKLEDAGKEKYYRFVCDKISGSCSTCQQYNNKVYRENDPNKPQLPLHRNCKCKLTLIEDKVLIKQLDIAYETQDNYQQLQKDKMKGFESQKYAEHDRIIAAVVADFNANKMQYAGCTEEQSKEIPDMTPQLLKSFLIQESGGSTTAWNSDPGQVNVPGDWNQEKAALGLQKSERRNEGELRANIVAALKYLVRKGFGRSGQAAANRPSGCFDGWDVALQRYNAGKGVTEDGRPVADEYTKRIMKRAEDPNEHVPVEFKKIEK